MKNSTFHLKTALSETVQQGSASFHDPQNNTLLEDLKGNTCIEFG